jgi:tetratricopeptide (TPR) repeat protein
MKRNTLFYLLALALLALVILAYANHFHNPFEFDDSHTIVDNAYIRDLKNIPRFFWDVTTMSTLPQNQGYRPGLTTLDAIDYAIAGGLDPFYFHLSIFISYLILGLLLYLFFAKIVDLAFDRPWNHYLALFATGWFMLHAANAETINYIIQRGDSFSTLMVVLGFVLYQYKPAWRKSYVYLLPMVAGFFVKSPALMFAPLLLCYDLLFERGLALTDLFKAGQRRKTLRALLAALPAFGLALVLFLFGEAMVRATSHASISRLNYLITQPFVLVHYFDNFLLPLQLSVDPDWTLLSTPLDDRFFVGMAFVVGTVVVALVASRRRESRPISFGILWFFIALLPTSSLFPLTQVMNDHRTFFPYIGLVLAFSCGAGLVVTRYESVLTRRRVAGYVLVGLLVVFLAAHAYGTTQRNRVWRTSESLWLDATIKSPNNARALMNYGLTQMAKGNYEVALDYYNRALALQPTYSYLQINLGILYAAMGQPEEAEPHFQKAVSYYPSDPSGYYYYGRWLYQEGRLDEAQKIVSQALALSPGYVDAQELSSSIEQKRGGPTLADLLAEVERNPTYEAYLNLGLAYYRAGSFQQSIDATNQALNLKPDSSIAYNNICAAYNRLERWEQAVEACQRALALDPGFERARNNLRVAENALK